MLKAKENVAKINEARAAEREEPVNKEDEEDPQLPGVAKSAMKDLQEMKDVANGNNALTFIRSQYAEHFSLSCSRR